MSAPAKVHGRAGLEEMGTFFDRRAANYEAHMRAAIPEFDPFHTSAGPPGGR
ncbi:MAG: hypothetical protein ACP5G2_08630 [Candidatus Bipolaricaulaceae bacterium]